MRRHFAALLLVFALSSCETLDLAELDFAPISSRATTVRTNKVTSIAMSWNGRSYKHGQTKRCADWVGYVVRKAGYSPPKGYLTCSNWMKWGSYVPRSSLKPGDIVIFRGTYKAGISHIGIAIDRQRFIHRSTYKAPVRITNLSRYQIAAVRRPKR